jgi:hypothetical protein
MGLETFSFISSLNATNPVGATDPKSAGDDHLRGIKATLLASFAAITGAVTASQTELNNLTGVTGKTGTGNVVLSASPTLTGTVTAATVAATTITGAGSGITALNASNLASGTVPDARFPATLPAVSAANLTNIPAANLSGSIADARLSANVPLINAPNVFTNNQGVTITGGDCIYALSATGAHSPYASLTSNGTTYGYIGIAGAAGNLINGSAAGDLCFRADSGAFLFGPSAAPSLKLSNAGVVTAPRASSSEVGYVGMPVEIHTGSGAYTLVAADMGKTVYVGGSVTSVVLPAGLPAGFCCAIMNNLDGTTPLTRSSTNLALAGVSGGASADRTIAVRGLMYLINLGSDSYMCSGMVS